MRKEDWLSARLQYGDAKRSLGRIADVLGVPDAWLIDEIPDGEIGGCVPLALTAIFGPELVGANDKDRERYNTAPFYEIYADIFQLADRSGLSITIPSTSTEFLDLMEMDNCHGTFLRRESLPNRRQYHAMAILPFWEPSNNHLVKSYWQIFPETPNIPHILDTGGLLECYASARFLSDDDLPHHSRQILVFHTPTLDNVLDY